MRVLVTHPQGAAAGGDSPDLTLAPTPHAFRRLLRRPDGMSNPLLTIDDTSGWRRIWAGQRLRLPSNDHGNHRHQGDA